MFSDTAVKYLLSCTFCILFCSAFFLIPYEDSYYYWDWSRHLGLSYFDGPPMIAYIFRLFTWIFGHTKEAINLLGITSIFLTLMFIYHTALLLNPKIAWTSCLLWILSTPVFHYLFFWVTYDNPLNVFWAGTMFFALRFVSFHKTQDLYWIGFFSGLMLLSKYTGVVLLLAFGIFILITRYRLLFKNKHFYFSMGLILLIESPVIIWNIKHQWISILYQYGHHIHYKNEHFKVLLTYFCPAD